jgi:hypothetical protein
VLLATNASATASFPGGLAPGAAALIAWHQMLGAIGQ